MHRERCRRRGRQKQELASIIGLTEDTIELITEKVSEVFEVLAQKPKIEAVRIGLKLRKKTSFSARESLVFQCHDCDSNT